MPKRSRKRTDGKRERKLALKAMEMIEEISADAQTTHPQKRWKESYEAVCRIYQLAHSIRAPRCRKNHPDWHQEIKFNLKADRDAKAVRLALAEERHEKEKR